MADPCQQFLVNPTVNPYNGRNIVIGGPIYQNLVSLYGTPKTLQSFQLPNLPSQVVQGALPGLPPSLSGINLYNFSSLSALSDIHSIPVSQLYIKVPPTVPKVSQILQVPQVPQIYIPQFTTMLSQVPRTRTTSTTQLPPVQKLVFPIQTELQLSPDQILQSLPTQPQSYMIPVQPVSILSLSQAQSLITMPQQPPASPQYSAQTLQEIEGGCVINLIGRSNEDRYVSAILNRNIRMYGVFDGHGGNSVVDYIKNNLPLALAKALYGVNFNNQSSVTQAITQTYIDIDREMFNSRLISGSTAIVALIKDNIVYLINLGDSRAIIFNTSGQILLETRDFKPADEVDRIRAAGGIVTRFGIFRVNGILAVSRAFGDFILKFTYTAPSSPMGEGIYNEDVYNPNGPVSVIPEVYQYNLEANPTFILLASDGLFDAFSSQEAINAIIRSTTISNVYQSIVQQARSRTTDDITAIIVQLN